MTHTELVERASQAVLVVRTNLPMQVDLRDASSIPGSGGAPGEGHGSPFQYSCLQNLMDRGACLGYNPWGHKELDITEAT